MIYVITIFNAGLTFFILRKVMPKLYPEVLSDSDLQGGRDYTLKLIEWERDRVMTIAKGIAKTAVTYLAALVPFIIKNQLSPNVSGFLELGTVLGFLGCLMLALDMIAATNTVLRGQGTMQRIGRDT